MQEWVDPLMLDAVGPIYFEISSGFEVLMKDSGQIGV